MRATELNQCIRRKIGMTCTKPAVLKSIYCKYALYEYYGTAIIHK
jgi:hypothetical protein